MVDKTEFTVLISWRKTIIKRWHFDVMRDLYGPIFAPLSTMPHPNLAMPLIIPAHLFFHQFHENFWPTFRRGDSLRIVRLKKLLHFAPVSHRISFPSHSSYFHFVFISWLFYLNKLFSSCFSLFSVLPICAQENFLLLPHLSPSFYDGLAHSLISMEIEES